MPVSAVDCVQPALQHAREQLFTRSASGNGRAWRWLEFWRPNCTSADAVSETSGTVGLASHTRIKVSCCLFEVAVWRVPFHSASYSEHIAQFSD